MVVATVYAQRLQLRQTDLHAKQGSSDTQQMVRRSVQIGKYLIRWRSDVTPKMRVSIDGTDYEITGLDEPDRRQTLKIAVTSLSAITANVGLLRTATSGQRTETDNNGGRSYDSNGTLRVRWGVW